jgi:hypothetical protein
VSANLLLYGLKLLSLGGGGTGLPLYPSPCPLPFTGPSSRRGASCATGGRSSKLFLAALWVLLRDLLLERERPVLSADLLRLRPLEAGDFDLRLRRVFRSLCDAYDELVEELRDRLGRLRGASRTLWEDMYWSPSASTCPTKGLRFGGGEADLDAVVEMVETEDVDMDLDPTFRLPL